MNGKKGINIGCSLCGKKNIKFHNYDSIISFVQKGPRFLQMRTLRLREVKNTTSVSWQIEKQNPNLGFSIPKNQFSK